MQILGGAGINTDNVSYIYWDKDKIEVLTADGKSCEQKFEKEAGTENG